MKNSLKSQGVFVVIFVLVFMWGGAIFGRVEGMGDALVRIAVVAVVTLVALIYFVVKAKKKLRAFITDIVALVLGILYFMNEISYYLGKADSYTTDELSFYIARTFLFSVSTVLVVVTVIMLILLIVNAVKYGTSKVTSEGFFKKEVTCAICGKTTGLNRYKMGETTKGEDIWQCAECAKKYSNNYIEVDFETGKIEVIPESESEKRIKCNVCGHVHCYNLKDIKENQRHTKNAVWSSVASVGNAVGGTQLGTHANLSRAEREMDKIVDFSRCPKCNSTDIHELTKEEWEKEKTKSSRGSDNISSADELKKFKDLLDSGIITQEEFEAKKKQLLGL